MNTASTSADKQKEDSKKAEETKSKEESDKMSKEELAKTGDSTKGLLTAECALVIQNPDAHAKVQNVGA